MGIKLEDLPERFQLQAKRQLQRETASRNRIANKTAEQKRPVRDALVTRTEAPQITTPVHIVFDCYRCIDHWDIDNVDTKIIDGLVKSGILQDDDSTQIKGITKRPFKVKHKADEKVIIRIYEA